MNRQIARKIHEATNTTYWLENPDWSPSSLSSRLSCATLRALPFSVHAIQKRLFFETDGLIAVNGESVVVANGTNEVDKFMFRYPNKMPLEEFKERVAAEVGVLTGCLAGVALPTGVAIKPARVFRRGDPLPTVAQTQQRLDLDVHQPLQIERAVESPPLQREKTAKDLEGFLQGVETLVTKHDFYADAAYNSANLRSSVLDGTVTLIDVMPVYADGSRLIGDNTGNLVEHIQDTIVQFQEFVGQYGS